MDTTALLFAFGAAVFWGTYLVPVKNVQLAERPYVLFMGLAMFTVVAIFPFVLGNIIRDMYIFGLGVLGGLTWSMGNLFSIFAVRGLVIARSIPIFIFSLIVNAVWSIVMFHELRGNAVIMMTGAVALVMVGAITAQLTGIRVDKKVAKGSAQKEMGKEMVMFGLMAAAITAMFFGTYNAAVKAMETNPLTGGVGLVFGTAIASTFIGLMWFDKAELFGGASTRTAGLACLSGILWAIGTILSIFAIERMGLAKTFPVTTLNVVIYLCWGIFYFKEVPREKLWLTVLGTSVLFLGVILVASM